jgi:elongation factor 1 alpha-like protein
MDTGAEERERGVTFDFAQHHFRTDAADFTILDAPGHRDFVPNMIGGASMADIAVLVVDANQLESGMKGQTREHILLAKAVGLQKIVVAVNKLDSATPAWSEQLFDSVKTEVAKLLKDAGFRETDITFVPCSGLSGDNVAKSPQKNKAASWIVERRLPTLLQALQSNVVRGDTDTDVISKSLRMQIVDVFRGSITNPLSVAGRISSGNVQVGDTVMIQPSGETAAIRAIDVGDEQHDYAVAGQICTLHLQDIDPQHLRSGDLICDARHTVQNKKTFVARIEVLDALLPQPVDMHIGRLHMPATISQLVETLDAKGEQLKRRPRVLKAGQRARVKIAFEDAGAPIEAGERVVLRSGGVTTAYGVAE